MEAEKSPAVPRGWQCVLAGGAAGVAPVLGMLAIHFFVGCADALIRPAFAPEAAPYLCGWGIAGLCLAASVALQWEKIRNWPMPVWTVRVAQTLLIPAWAACLAGMPALGFALLVLLSVCAAVSVRAPLRGASKGWQPIAAALLACPMLLWSLYIISVLYISLMTTP